MANAPHNVDDLLNKKLTPAPVTVTNQVEPTESQSISEEPAEKSEEKSESEEKLTFTERFHRDKAEALGITDENSEKIEPEIEEKEQEPEEKPQKLENKAKESEETDEYGNELPKARTYTEEEVQRMIRDRLSRGKAVEQPQPTQQQVQDANQKGFEVDPNSADSWETQLSNFNDKWYEGKQKKEQENHWKAQEQHKQAEFEAKMGVGMQRYKDFAQVLGDKPITNAILLSARGMKDPAAFLYAAAKQAPKELERIAQITDPYQVAAEVGRLEERMRKARTTSQAPRPLTRTKSDIAVKNNEGVKPSLDQLIQSDAKRKLGRR